MLYDGERHGGHANRVATANVLKNIVGYDNLDIILSELDTTDWGCNIVLHAKSYQTIGGKIKNILSGNITQRSNNDICKIVQIINKNRYDVVIFGSSETGKLISEVKRHCNVKTITVYDDILKDIISKNIKHNFDLKMLPIQLAEIHAEKIDSMLTDIPIVLHRRDADLLYNCWGRKTEMLIPTALKDGYVVCSAFEPDDHKGPLNLLFVGAYNWRPNTEAVRWFCENVMAQLKEENVQLNIAGYQMEHLYDDDWIRDYKNVFVLGTVDDLAEVYRKADVVVCPIWLGSGMKVKVAEALMHGKEILGTEEALVGYDDLKACTCNNADDFIRRIKMFCQNRPNRFNPNNRRLYEQCYSAKALEDNWRRALCEIESI